jgi:hypothetical protein
VHRVEYGPRFRAAHSWSELSSAVIDARGNAHSMRRLSPQVMLHDNSVGSGSDSAIASASQTPSRRDSLTVDSGRACCMSEIGRGVPTEVAGTFFDAESGCRCAGRHAPCLTNPAGAAPLPPVAPIHLFSIMRTSPNSEEMPAISSFHACRHTESSS